MDATAARERPILFSAPMVRAILDGKKSQTRRIVKPSSLFDGKDAIVKRHPHQSGCQYGKPGDQLWVRETWGLHDTQPVDGQENATIYYRATDGEAHSLRYQLWRPSIYMPRWASRIMLEITDVRVQRLQEISEEDATAEGCPGWYSPSAEGNTDGCMPSEEYAALWDSINGKTQPWASNPWVWCISFKRIEDSAHA